MLKLKKFLMGVACAVAMFAVSLVATGCDHTHEFSSDWSQSETHHWYAATCEHSEEVSNMAAHDFDATFTCQTCGYTLSNIYVGTNVYQAVSSAEENSTIYVSGNIELPISIPNGLVIVGVNTTTVDVAVVESHNRLGTEASRITDVTFKNLEFNNAICFIGNATFENCTFSKGMETSTAHGNTTFKDCKFYYQSSTANKCLHFDAGDDTGVLVIDNCQFLTGGIAIKGFSSIDVKNSTFDGYDAESNKTFGWKYFVTYQTAVFTDCVFEDGLTVRDDASGAKITLVNTEVGIG